MKLSDLAAPAKQAMNLADLAEPSAEPTPMTSGGVDLSDRPLNLKDLSDEPSFTEEAFEKTKAGVAKALEPLSIPQCRSGHERDRASKTLPPWPLGSRA